MQVQAVGLTDVGRKRAHNEDTLLVREDLGLYLVADGMGGHAAGEVASETAAQAVVRYIEERRSLLERFDEDEAGRDAVIRLVYEAINHASSEVYGLAVGDQGRAGMGTTLTMMLVVGDKGVMGHVGDSRLYLHRGGRLHQLSDDHSYVNELVRRGLMTREAAEDSPYANVITRAVGIQSTVQPDTLVFDVLPGDTYLLCSDGLSRYLEDEGELAQILAEEDLGGLPQRLVDLANERGGKDNVTALTVRVDDDAEEAERSTEVNLRVDTLRDISLFEHLTMKELLSVMDVLRSESTDEGEVIIREGESGDSLYIVLSGRLEVLRGDKVVAELERGTHVGEMALLNSRPRSATVRTLNPTRLLVMTRQAFTELVRREPDLGVKLLWTFAQVLSHRLDETTLMSSDVATMELPASLFQD